MSHYLILSFFINEMSDLLIYKKELMYCMENLRNKFDFNEVIYFLTVLITVFAMIHRFAIINIIILMILLILLLIRAGGKIKLSKTVPVYFIYILLILIQGMINPSEFFSFQVAIKEIVRLLIYFIITLIIINAPIREKKFLKIWNSIFLISLLIAVLQFYKLLGINEILEKIYGSSLHLGVAIKYTSLPLFRAGSILINPNTYAKFILAYLAVCISSKNKVSNKRITLFLQILSIGISLILAGSRTALIILIIMLFYSFFNNLIKKRMKFNLNNTILLVFFSIVICTGLIIVLRYELLNAEKFRLLDVVSGLDNSLKYKFITFNNITQRFNVLNLLIGLGPFENEIRGLTLIDFDIGYLITFYGVIGLIIYMIMIYDFYKYRRNIHSNYFLLNKLLIIIIILFGFTGGVFLNLRIFSIFLTLIYSNIVDSSGGEV